MTYTLNRFIRAWSLAAAAALTACQPRLIAPAAPARSPAATAAAHEAVREERALAGAGAMSRTIGVTAMRADTTDSVAVSIAYALSDLMIADLAQSPQLTVVDRMRTAVLADEIRLASTGDPLTAPSGGKFRAASELVVGALGGQASSELRLESSLIAVASGAVRAPVVAAAPLERVIDAEKKVTFGLMEQLGVVLSADERAAIARRRTTNARALVSYGRGVWLQVQHRDAEATVAFDEASAADPWFAPARARARESRVKAAAQMSVPAVARAVASAAPAVTPTVASPLSAPSGRGSAAKNPTASPPRSKTAATPRPSGTVASAAAAGASVRATTKHTARKPRIRTPEHRAATRVRKP